MTKRILAYLIALSMPVTCSIPVHAMLSDTVNRIPQPGASFTAQNQEFDRDEDSDRFHETACKEETFVYSGCLGATAASLTHTPNSCVAYARGFRLTETGAITYPDDSTCWVIYDRNVTGDLTSSTIWTRIPSTHYLKACVPGISVLTPTLPAGTGFTMRVITLSGAIEVVSDLRDFGDCTSAPDGFTCDSLSAQNCDLCPFVSSCPCVGLNQGCTQTSQCCEGFCSAGICVSSAVTSTTVTPTTTTTVSTSTTLALTAPAVIPDLFGSIFSGNLPSGGRMICSVEYLPVGITGATRLSSGFAGSGNCGLAVYDDDDGAATRKAQISGACPFNGTLTATVSSFDLHGGAQYRKCVCSDVTSTSYLGVYSGENLANLLNTFSTSVGVSTTSCTAGVPPTSTGPLTPVNEEIPFLWVE